MTTLHPAGIAPQSQVIPQQQQHSITYQSVQPPHSATIGYSVSAARQTGYTQIILGVLSVGIGIAAIVVGSIFGVIGAPIWSGVGFYLVAGILGVASAANPNSCLIIGHLVMSILSSLVAFNMMSIMVVGAIVEGVGCEYGGLYGGHNWGNGCYNNYYSRVIVDSIGALIALTEFIVAIIAAVICCQGSCGYNNTISQHTVVHQYVPNQPGNVTVMTAPQPYNQLMPMQGYAHGQQPQGYAVPLPQAYNAPQATNLQTGPGAAGQATSPPPYFEKNGGMPNPQA